MTPYDLNHRRRSLWPWLFFAALFVLSALALEAHAHSSRDGDGGPQRTTFDLASAAVPPLLKAKPCPGGGDGCSYAKRVRLWAPRIAEWCLDQSGGDDILCAYLFAHTLDSSVDPNANREGVDVGLIQFSLNSPQHLDACNNHFGRTIRPDNPEDSVRCWAWRIAGTYGKLTCKEPYRSIRGVTFPLAVCKRNRAKVTGIMGKSARPDWWAVALSWAGTGTLCPKHVGKEAADGSVSRVPSDPRCQSKYGWVARAILNSNGER